MNDLPATAAYFKALNERDEAAFAGCFAENCEAYNPFGLASYQGIDGIQVMFTSLTGTWAELQTIPKSAYTSGNRVAIIWMAEGIGHSGQKAEFEGVTVFELAPSGKIHRLEAYWDSRAAMKQISEPAD
jgi:ketosteroid isomerase-like protein